MVDWSKPIYFDICDIPFKMDDGVITVLDSSEDGKSVIEREPTPYERSMFHRNCMDSGVISEEIARKLALNPGLSY